MTGIAFDTLAYANKLKEAGFTDRQAETQAEALASVVESNLATKTDIELLRRDIKELELRLEARIADSKTEIIKWCVGSVFASVGLFAALVRLMG